MCAAPSNEARAQSVGTRPWLGLAMDMDAQGVRVSHVIRGSPAEAAGMHEGDHLLRVAGSAVGKASDVVQAVAALAVGNRVQIEFTRQPGQAPQTAQAVLAPFPSQDQMVRMDWSAPLRPPGRTLRGSPVCSLRRLQPSAVTSFSSISGPPGAHPAA